MMVIIPYLISLSLLTTPSLPSLLLTASSSSSSSSYALNGILSLDQTFASQLRELSSRGDAALSSVFSEVEEMRRADYLQRALYAVLTVSSPACSQPLATHLNENLTILSEYFSVSNDARGSKMMVGDAVPGQKLRLVEEGLASLRSDLRRLRACLPNEYIDNGGY